MPGSNRSDVDLLQSIHLNNEQAFNELFERHWSKVYAVSYRYVRDEETALEITHDIFLNIWNNRHKLNITSFKSYVVTSASYHAIRKKQQSKATPIDYVGSYEQDGEFNIGDKLCETNSGEEKIYAEEFNSRVLLMLEDLPARCREIYLLSRHDNLSITEIAAKLNISKRTVENQLTVALKHLRTILNCSGLLIILAAYQ